MATPTYDLLDSVTLASSASSVTFSSISQDYGDLVLVVSLIPAQSGDNFAIRVNGDTGSNYNSVYAEGNGSGVSSLSNTNQTRIIIPQTWTVGNTSEAGTLITNFSDYSATDKHKSLLSRVNRGGAGTTMAASRYASTSAITSITIGQTTYDLGAGTTAHLYGIAKAL